EAPVASELAAAIESCRAALETAEMRESAAALRSRGLAASDGVSLIEQVGRQPEAANRVAELRKFVSGDLAQLAAIERRLLLQTGVRYAAPIQGLRMSRSVLRYLADELRFLAAPPRHDCGKLLAPTDGFIAMAKVVTLRRFPAGQLHFEQSG